MIWKNTLLNLKNLVMNRMIFMRHWDKGISSLSGSLKDWESGEENQVQKVLAPKTAIQVLQKFR